MAAHPFGPIEKFLITSCKPLKNDPRDAKLVFGDKQCFECPSVEDNLFWGFCQPRHVLEPTANVNSSDYKVQTALKVPEKEVNEGMYSLSRGLGYRITFTMPADREWRVDFTELWPSMEIQVLDFFGEKVLASFKYEPSTGNDKPQKEPKRTIHPEDFSTTVEMFETAERLYGKMGTLTLELTSLGVKAYKDSEVVVEVPFYSKAKTDDPKLAEFGIIATRLLNQSVDALDWLFARLEGFAYYFTKNHSKVTEEHLLTTKPVILGLLEHISSVWVYLSPKFEKDEEQNPIPKLEKDLVSWMDGDSNYPDYFNCRLVKELITSFWLRAEKYGSMLVPLNNLEIKGWSPHLLRMFANVLKSPDLDILDLADRSRKFFTKDFTILQHYKRNTGILELFFSGAPNGTTFFETNRPKALQKNAFLSDIELSESRKQTCDIASVVPDRNLIVGKSIFGSSNRGSFVLWRIVDLEKAHAVHTGKSTEAPFADIMIPMGDNYSRPGLEPYACRTGLFIRHKNAMEFYSYDALFARKADEEYLRIPIVLGEDREQKIVDLSVKESKGGREFFVMAKIKKTILPDKPNETDVVAPTNDHDRDGEDHNEDNQSGEDHDYGELDEPLDEFLQDLNAQTFHYFSFVRMTLSTDMTNMTVTAKCDHRFEEVLGEQANMLWVEDKSGMMFGSISTPGKEGEAQLLVFVMIYCNRKFTPLRFKRKQRLDMFPFTFSQQLLTRFQSTHSRLGWKELKFGHNPSLVIPSSNNPLLLVDQPTYTEDGDEIICISRLQLKI